MVYRDDLQAAQARIAELERELARARAELRTTREQRSQALILADRGALAGRADARDRSPAARWLGAPVRLAFYRRVSGTVPPAAHTEIIELVREWVGEVGTVTQMEGSLAWTSTANLRGTGPFVTVALSAREAGTAIRVEERLGNLAGAIYGGVGGGVAGGALGVPIMAAVLFGPIGALAIPAWLGAWWLALRAIYRRAARTRAQRLQALADQLAELVERRAGGPAGPRDDT